VFLTLTGRGGGRDHGRTGRRDGRATVKALLYLAVRRLVNSVRRIPGSPRLLLPILFFVLVFGLQLVAFFLAGGGARPTAEQGAPAFTPEAFIEGGPGALVAAVRGVLLISVFTSVVAAFGDGTLFLHAQRRRLPVPGAAPAARRAPVQDGRHVRVAPVPGRLHPVRRGRGDRGRGRPDAARLLAGDARRLAVPADRGEPGAGRAC
jgi:hypothetical protein